MPKPPPQRVPPPDPMSGVVDRLLAQLPGLQDRDQPARAPYRVSEPVTVAGSARRNGAPTERSRLAMWIRVLLGLTLAVTMGAWPYSRDCGLPLFSYFAAVSMVLLAGVWAGVASWRQRGALAHVISLTLVLYAILLVGSELLPRTGYATEHASWSCNNLGGVPSSIVLSRVGSLPEK